MQTLRNSAALALLLILCCAGLQLSFLLVQASELLNDMHERTARAVENANRTLAILRETTEQQRGQYESIARHTARSLASLALLIEHTDAQLVQLAPAAHQAIAATATAAGSIAHESGEVGYETRLLLASSRGTMDNLERLTNNPALEQSATNLARSSENLEKATAASAEATGHIRDMLSPRKKAFWRRVIELLIPRPTIRVGR